MHTRHNAGQDAVLLLAERHGVRLKRAMGRALSAHVRVDGKLLALADPGDYMNLSGEGLVALVRRYGVDDLTRLVIVHDELDLPTGRVQLKLGGGLAGHNGLKSVKHHLKTDAFTRVRIGIDRPPGRQSPADYVLRNPRGDERIALDIAIERAADAVETILARGVDAAMAEHNSQA